MEIRNGALRARGVEEIISLTDFIFAIHQVSLKGKVDPNVNDGLTLSEGVIHGYVHRQALIGWMYYIFDTNMAYVEELGGLEVFQTYIDSMLSLAPDATGEYQPCSEEGPCDIAEVCLSLQVEGVILNTF